MQHLFGTDSWTFPALCEIFLTIKCVTNCSDVCKFYIRKFKKNAYLCQDHPVKDLYQYNIELFNNLWML